MPTFAVQYLESPYPEATLVAVRQRLRQACERLPITMVLLGWELPPAIEEAVAEETTLQHAQLFHWQPLLTGDAHTDLPSEWATYGPGGNPIAGHNGKPEFTFICPNRNAVTDFLNERLESAIASGLYNGLFLDRIRFPSPSRDPLCDLACFCHYCSCIAADIGFDLESVRRNILSLPVKTIINSLFGHSSKTSVLLDSFLDFRSASITRLVRMAAEQAQASGLSIGLDCFSPALTRMVGQNLSTLVGYANWVKIMTYPRVFGPAGISFELLKLAKWLIQNGISDFETMQFLRKASGLPLPGSSAELGRVGLGSEIIKKELLHGYRLGVTNLLAGIAMVKMSKIHESTPEQIQTDLEACRWADGLVISWDLWLTPLEYLERIQEIWS